MAKIMLQKFDVLVHHLLVIAGLVLIDKAVAEQLHKEQSTCSYPPGSIPCKFWNYTNLDCSYRKLKCIPLLQKVKSAKFLDLSSNQLTGVPDDVFSNFHKLVRLDLSKNSISTVQNYAFTGPNELKHLVLHHNSLHSINSSFFTGLNSLLYLDLAHNNLKNLNGYPFQDLISLLELNLLYNGIRTLTSTTFVGLASLRQLDITLNMDSVSNCNNTEKAFNISLDKLQHLNIVHTSPTCYGYDMCSLVSSESLELHAGNIVKCSNVIPLQSLSSSLECQINDITHPYEMLQHLTNLSVHYPDMDSAVQDLQRLNSPLQSLSVGLYTYKNLYILPREKFTFDSLTFQSLSKWNQSLITLEIYCPNGTALIITGWPFKWFQNLQVLTIYTDSIQDSTIVPETKIFRGQIELSEDTFIGLEKLRELHLNHLEMTWYDIDPFHIFRNYIFLKVLDLKHTIMTPIFGNFKILIESIEELDMSQTRGPENIDYSICPACTLPNLKVFLIKDVRSNGISRWNLNKEACQKAPNLTILDASNKSSINIALNTSTVCPHLSTLRISHNYIFINFDKGDQIDLPNLEKLYLQQVTTYRHI